LECLDKSTLEKMPAQAAHIHMNFACMSIARLPTTRKADVFFPSRQGRLFVRFLCPAFATF
jgi:hypothetical protein